MRINITNWAVRACFRFCVAGRRIKPGTRFITPAAEGRSNPPVSKEKPNQNKQNRNTFHLHTEYNPLTYTHSALFVYFKVVLALNLINPVIWSFGLYPGTEAAPQRDYLTAPSALSPLICISFRAWETAFGKCVHPKLKTPEVVYPMRCLINPK